jgi:hypothetical protein
VIPEWPGQTHLWIWREICHMRELGADLRLFSTRHPPNRDRARHAFAPRAIAETIYLWPLNFIRVLRCMLVCLMRNPVGFARCVYLGFTLPVDVRLRFRRVLPLLAPACYLATQVRKLGIKHLHSHVPANSTILCMMAKRLTGVTFSQMVNANLEWWGGAMRQKLHDAEFSVACTQRLVTQIQREYPELDPARYGICRLGVDTQRWKPSPKPFEFFP